jgi:PBSX family phage terminase large subunit
LTPTELSKRPFRPYGAALVAWRDRGPEVLLSGPAGTGKSRGALEKLWACGERWPGSRILIARKTRKSLSETGLVTFEDKVIPANHAILKGAKRQHRQNYLHPNSTEFVIGGLDDMTKIMSGEYDLIFCQEAIEASEDDIEKLTTRLRNGVMPFQQLLLDTNPDGPQHWLKLRCDKGLTRLLESRHEDNPTLFDPETGRITAFGAQYLGVLDRLTGARHARLRLGRWVQSEGVVYDGWDRQIHVIDRFVIPQAWRRIRVIDFGYTNPFVCQWWAIDPDGRMYLYREIYHTSRLVRTQGAQILALSTGENIEADIADHDAEDRATLAELGIGTQAAYKAVTVGIQAVSARLAIAGDGKPRLFVLRDSLVEADESLIERKVPFCTEQEFDGYIWPKGADGKPLKEEPVKINDHGCDAARYACGYVDSLAGGWAHNPGLWEWMKDNA